ncbi:MAG TPA: hypothetical protein VMS89_10060 [Methanoregulaceae archaeon]|nr:hypothetical protein [Methanoregulaceae archaeon]
MMSKIAVDSVFHAMFLLTDLRVILRETAPLHELDDQQRETAERILNSLMAQVQILEKELLR